MGKTIVYAHIVPKELTGTVDKYYIGITNQSTRKRWGLNGCNYHGSHFSYAIKKYGWENIKHIVLFEDLDRDVAEEIEKYIIAKYHTDDKVHGYNTSPGGDGGNQKAVYKVSQYDIDGNFIAEYKSAAEAARVLGIDRTNITHACKIHGTAHGYQFRYSNGQMFIGRRVRATQYPVEQIDMSGNVVKRFSSITEASEVTGVKHDNIHRVISKKKWAKTAGGYYWRRSNDGL